LFISELNHIIQFIKEYLSAINDRNEKRQLQTELRYERNLLRTIIDAIPETIAFKDLNETYRLTNKRTDIEYRNRFESIEGKTGNRWWLWVSRSASVVYFLIAPGRGADVPVAHFKNIAHQKIISAKGKGCIGKFINFPEVLILE